MYFGREHVETAPSRSHEFAIFLKDHIAIFCHVSFLIMSALRCLTDRRYECSFSHTRL